MKGSSNEFTQLSIFDEITKLINGNTADISQKDYAEIINHLKNAQQTALAREKEEKRRREEEERKKKEEQKRQKEEEHIKKVTSMDLPLSWENIFSSDERTQGVHADSISDGLIMSLANLARVDIEYISSITGEDYKTVICALRGSIFQNPEAWDECFYKGWETAEEYLSGNLMKKWKSAKEANEKYRGYFSENIRAIEKVLPPTIATKDIYVTLGSPWVPADVIDDFIEHLYGRKFQHMIHPGKNHPSFDYYGTIHDELTGTWEIPCKTRYGHNVTDTKTYGTDKLEALYILEKTLNMKSMAVMDEVSCPTNASGIKRVINKEETVLAIEKQQKMIAEFQNWVWSDPARRERLEMIFENNFSCVRRRIFDGSFLTFPGIAPHISLYPYQKNAVARILFSQNTLLAHDVGSGKTYIMLAAGMELRRMGISKKNLFVVPNNIIGQWERTAREMYPSSDFLVVEPKNFTPQKRIAVLEKIRDRDFDGIIMAYSCFERIPLSHEFYADQLLNTYEQTRQLLENAKKSTSKLRKYSEKIKKQLSELNATLSGLSNDVYFDELGITRLFIDEAHNYKNVPIETKVDKVLGITTSGSKKCSDMMDKVRMVQKTGGGVIMATGTPITNSITDAYIFQKYLQSGELGLLDLQSFDSWIGMFAERVTEFEIDVDTSSYRLATRFSKFHNLPELTSLLSQVADFHRADSENGLPQFDGYTDSLISKTKDFSKYLKDISSRADDVRHGRVMRTDDNMLKITTDGRKAALDLRLALPQSTFTYQSKAFRCAENVYSIYLNTANKKSTQLIFCDTSTPKSGFNMYSELRLLLCSMGVPSDHIAFIHDATTEKRRSMLFDAVRKGDIRILIGSTFKLGLGVNVQDKLIAIHHLDIPWRPADMTQREGRILRQNNENEKVYIYRYITEGSFDAYSWQLLETKQRFITGLLSGSYDERSGTDIEDTALNYAEIKALAVGNPLIKKRVETANELTRYLTLQRKTVETRIRLEKELSELPAQIDSQKRLIYHATEDKKNTSPLPIPQNTAEKNSYALWRKSIREKIFNALSENELKSKESYLMNYRGFKIILPANMIKEKPYVWLAGCGRYYVEAGGTEIGALVRIDNFIDNISIHIEKLHDGLFSLTGKMGDMEKELLNVVSYSDEIENLKTKLEEIDKKLGVDKK